MAFASTKCEHPFKKVKTAVHGYDYDEYFKYCGVCREFLEWSQQITKKGEIPFHWPDEIKELAVEISGVKVQQDPNTKIRIPDTGRDKDVPSSNLADILLRRYNIEDVKILSKLDTLNFAQIEDRILANAVKGTRKKK